MERRGERKGSREGGNKQDRVGNGSKLEAEGQVSRAQP